MPTGGIADDNEIYRHLSDAYAWLVEALAESGIAYAESEQAYVSTGVTPGSYALPSSFYAVKHVLRTDVDPPIPLDELSEDEYWRYPSQAGDPLGHRVVGSNLVVYPPPRSGLTFKLVYIPAASILDSSFSATPIDGIAGYERFCALDAASRVMAKEGRTEEVMEMKQEREREWQRILAARVNRQMLQDRRSGRNREFDYYDPDGFWIKPPR